MSPQELWILNPTQLVIKSDSEPAKLERINGNGESNIVVPGTAESSRDCWICYDDRKDILIQPCQCRGDVSSVHHECLRRWLIECAANSASMVCKVCGTPYNVQKTSHFKWKTGFTTVYWIKIIAMITVMFSTIATALILVRNVNNAIIQISAAGFAILTVYVSVRIILINAVSAYKRSKVTQLSIMSGQLNTISEKVSLSTKGNNIDKFLHNSDI